MARAFVAAGPAIYGHACVLNADRELFVVGGVEGVKTRHLLCDPSARISGGEKGRRVACARTPTATIAFGVARDLTGLPYDGPPAFSRACAAIAVRPHDNVVYSRGRMGDST